MHLLFSHKSLKLSVQHPCVYSKVKLHSSITVDRHRATVQYLKEGNI